MRLKDRLVAQIKIQVLLALRIIAVICTMTSSILYFYQDLASYLALKDKINDCKRNQLAFYFTVLQ